MSPDTERQALEKAMIALEAQRATYGDALVDSALGALRDKLAALGGSLAQGKGSAAQGKGSGPAAGNSSAGQRKQVTTLMADMVGFTALSEQIEAQTLRNLVDALWSLLDSVVVSHFGTVEQHIGDALVAQWGVPAAREDDAEQAVRAALALQRAMNEFNTQRGANLRLRVGVHTGLALVEPVDGAPGKFRISGEPLSGADALQAGAAAGGVLVSQDTCKRARAQFELEPGPLVMIKGRADPLATFRVRGVAARGFYQAARGIEGIETHMIGRDSELDVLKNTFEQACQEAQRQMVTISGEAGVGKTRLIAEFERWLAARHEPVALYKGRASQDLRSVPFALMRDLINFRFGIQDNDRPALVRRKLEHGIAGVLGPGSVMKAHFLGHLLGIDFQDSPHLRGALADSRQLRDRGIAYLHEYFDSVASSAPAVVLLEDVHWADDSSLELLNSLARIANRQRLLVVIAARPALFERLPDWGRNQAFSLHLALQPLSGPDSRRLVADILRRVEPLPAVLSDMVARGAGGNPFYVEELIKMLIEDGVIQAQGERWQVQLERLTVARVPATLEGVLQARLDSLPASERGTLQRAAVVGPVFWDEALLYLDLRDPAHLRELVRKRQTASLHASLDALRMAVETESSPDAPHLADAEPSVDSAHSEGAAHPAGAAQPTGESARSEERLAGQLEGLTLKEMISPSPRSSFAGTREFLFKHNLLREVAYQGLLKRERRGFHARVAEWLVSEARFSQREGEYAALIAEHYDQAGDDLAAAEWYRRTGELAAARFGNSEAVSCFSRALALLPENDLSGRYELLLGRERVLDLLAQRLPQRQDLDALSTLAEHLEDPLRQAEVALRQANFGLVTSDFPAAIAAAQRALGLARQADAHGAEPQASAAALPALSISTPGWARFHEARTLLLWGHALYRLGELDEAREKLTAAFDLAQNGQGSASGITGALQDAGRSIQAESLRWLGVIENDQGNYPSAEQRYLLALDIYRTLGDRQGESTTLSSLGNLAIDRAEHGLARSYHEQSLSIKREIGDRRGEARALGNLGFVASDQGDYMASKGYFEQARSLFREIGDRQGQSIALVNLGNDALAQGDYPGARAYQEQALRVQREVGDRQGESIALDNLSLIYHLLGEHQTALGFSLQALDIARPARLRHVEGYVLNHMGHALLALERLTEAEQAYQEALDLRLDLGEATLAAESRTGLARVALRRGDTSVALSHVLPILDYLENGTVDGMVEPFRVFLTCYQVLHRAGDPRARQILSSGYQRLQNRARMLSDANMRQSFLAGVVVHRELVAAYESVK